MHSVAANTPCLYMNLDGKKNLGGEIMCIICGLRLGTGVQWVEIIFVMENRSE